LTQTLWLKFLLASTSLIILLSLVKFSSLSPYFFLFFCCECLLLSSYRNWLTLKDRLTNLRWLSLAVWLLTHKSTLLLIWLGIVGLSEWRVVLPIICSLVIRILLVKTTSGKHTSPVAHILSSVLFIKCTLESLVCQTSYDELSDWKCKNKPKYYKAHCVFFKICSIARPLNSWHYYIHETRKHNYHHLTVMHRCVTHIINPNRN